MRILRIVDTHFLIMCSSTLCFQGLLLAQLAPGGTPSFAWSSKSQLLRVRVIEEKVLVSLTYVTMIGLGGEHEEKILLCVSYTKDFSV